MFSAKTKYFNIKEINSSNILSGYPEKAVALGIGHINKYSLQMALDCQCSVEVFSCLV